MLRNKIKKKTIIQNETKGNQKNKDQTWYKKITKHLLILSALYKSQQEKREMERGRKKRSSESHYIHILDHQNELGAPLSTQSRMGMLW